MKSLLVLLIFFATLMAEARETNDWENPQIISINKEKTVASFSSYADKDDALLFKQPESEISLNGRWKFNWVAKPDERPGDFYKSDFDVSAWEDIMVPGNWQLQGFGLPVYTNIKYPFEKDQPKVSSKPPQEYTSYKLRNPIGSYKREFNVPEEWDGKEVFIRFDGVKSAFETGRGRIVVRGKAHIETTPNGREKIIVTEIPYMVNSPPVTPAK